MAKYKTLLMKMAIDGPTNDKAKANFDLFWNVKILLGFVAIFSLLQLFYNLIKFSKLQDVVICDFMVAKKMCQGKIYNFTYTWTQGSSMMHLRLTRLYCVLNMIQ
jgi:hypothetical protein